MRRINRQLDVSTYVKDKYAMKCLVKSRFSKVEEALANINCQLIVGDPGEDYTTPEEVDNFSYIELGDSGNRNKFPKLYSMLRKP